MLFNILIENLVKLPFKDTAKLLCYADDLQSVVRGQPCLTYVKHSFKFIKGEIHNLGIKINPNNTKAVSVCRLQLDVALQTHRMGHGTLVSRCIIIQTTACNSTDKLNTYLAGQLADSVFFVLLPVLVPRQTTKYLRNIMLWAYGLW